MERGPGRPGSPLPGLRLTGVIIVAFALLVLYEATRIREGGGYTVIGPRFFPLVAGGGLLAFGLLFLLRTTAWPDVDLIEQAREEGRMTHWVTVLLMAALLVGYAILLNPLGYVVATALFVPAAARVLGSRHPLRDLLLGIALGLVIYFGFTELLGVRLPAGLLGRIV